MFICICIFIYIYIYVYMYIFDIYAHICIDIYTFRKSFRGVEGLTISPRPLHDTHRLLFSFMLG